MQPILILGAGINGAAIARELAINGVPVVVVDTADLASGTTAYSSRLIHGGLRYLEYGEFDLVRESLAERGRWLRHAPHLVRPLELFIPVRNWCGGLWTAAKTFFGWGPGEERSQSMYRGLAPIRFGLWLYDRYAHDKSLPSSRTHRLSSLRSVRVDPAKFLCECSYTDAQIIYPERLTVEMLADGAEAARDRGVEFKVLTYHRADLEGSRVTITHCGSTLRVEDSQPAAIINATGAWVDMTLTKLLVPAERLIGGTKGSHFLTHQAALRDKLAGRALYVEAADGRPVFILPFGEGTLIGTTDEPFEGPPDAALATDLEIEYLLSAVNDVLPDVGLRRTDIELHYCGVRPLPFVDSKTPAAITRRHWLHEHAVAPLPVFSVIGGKLTTCRSLAEETARTVLRKLGVEPSVTSRERPLPGARDYPVESALAEVWQNVATRFGLRREQVRAVWSLYGARTNDILTNLSQQQGFSSDSLPGTDLPQCIARWSIAHEWVATLDDLVERRLMLLYHPRLSLATLAALADELVAVGRIMGVEKIATIAAAVERLHARFGKRITC